MEMDKWIRRNRLLKPTFFSNDFINKERIINDIYRTVLDGRAIPAQLFVYESHQADISQIPTYNAIICDVHFRDVAWLIASAYYSESWSDVIQLANLLLSDSLLCHGNPELALDYARKFNRGHKLSIHENLDDTGLIQTINTSTMLQMAFALGHEVEHYSTQEDKPINLFLRLRMNETIEHHNKISQIINSIDLTPIIDMLNPIAEKRIQTIKDPEEALFETIKAFKMINLIVESNFERFDIPDATIQEKKKLIHFACDNYIRGTKANLLPVEELKNESMCDLLSLISLFDIGIDDMHINNRVKLEVEAYVLALLAADMIHLSSIVSYVSIENVHEQVDSIFMRRRLEKEIIPELLSIFFKDFPNIEYWYSNACAKFDRLYQIFCDYIFTLDFPCHRIIPHGSAEWKEYYFSINNLLQLPI